MPSYASGGEYVYLPVPRHLLLEAYGWLAARAPEKDEQAEDPSDPHKLGAEDAREVSEPSSAWPPELIRRMYKESPGSMKTLMGVLASRPEETVYARELLGPLGEFHGQEGPASRRSLAGTLGAFGRRVLNRYGRKSWPFEARWSHEHHEMEYRMSREVADQVRELARPSAEGN